MAASSIRLRVNPSLLPQEVEFQQDGADLQYRYVGTSTWITLGQFGATLTIGTVSTLGPNDIATVENVGTPQNAILNIGIPAGSDGLVQTIVEGPGLTVDSSDANNPVVSIKNPTFADLGDAIAFNPATAPEFTQTAGYGAAGDGGGALYKLVVAEPSHEGKYQDAAGNWYEIAETIINPKMLGAKGDGVAVTGNTSITSGAAALTVVGASFTAADVGKFIEVPGAGAAGAALQTTIAGYTSATQVTLTANASTTLSAVSNTVTYGTDDAPAVQDAIDIVDDGTGGIIFFPRAKYLLNDGLVSLLSGVILEGDGLLATTLLACHTSEPVYRWQRGQSGVRAMTIDATPGRTAASLGSNYGLHGEAPDTASLSVAGSIIDEVRILNQPSHGLRMVGTIQESLISDLLVQSNVGHGAMFDSGESSSRTNYSQPGIVTLDRFWAISNGGHGLVVGNDTDTSYPYRFTMNNLEATGNALSAGVRYNSNQVYIRGDNHYLVTPAFGGSDTTGCIYIEGKDHKLDRPRFIDSTSPAVTVGHTVTTLETVGVVVDRPRVISSAAQNPLISVTSGATNIEVYTDNTGGITSYMTADVPNSVIVTGTSAQRFKKEIAKDFRTKEVTIADDAATSVEFSAATNGMLFVTSSTTDRGGIAAFRVGSSGYCTKYGGSSLFAVSATGALTGTNGADTNLTVGINTANNKVYIENRTGATVTVTLTFVSVRGGAAILEGVS